MFGTFVRISMLCSAMLWVAGCGGGSASSGSSGGDDSTTVTFTITGGTPAAVATQIGSGSFTVATLTAGKLTLSLPSGTSNFAVAFACPGVSLTPINGQVQQKTEEIFQASTLDGTSFTETCPTAQSIGSTGTLTGAVDASAISGASYVEVLAANAQAQATATLGSTGNFSLAAPAGIDRVEALAYQTQPNGLMEMFSLVAAKDFSGQTVPGALNGGSTTVLAAADETTSQTLTYSGVPSGYAAPTTRVDYELGDGGAFLVAASATSSYPVLPAGATESGDSYFFTASAYRTLNPLEGAEVTAPSASAGPQSFTFPAPWTYAGPTPAARPSFDFLYTGFSGKTDVSDGAGIVWLTGGTVENVVVVTATANSLNGSTTLAVPDLSALSGFIAPPASGTALTWSAEISQGTTASGQSQAVKGPVTTLLNSGEFAVP